ncbi:MAG TPA: glycosyltransferase family 4 protein [Bacilli bacterium]|nr:glycosyltransferase family 4 protein [Bacilli bacterium]
MENNIIVINMLSQADTVPGQGVGSAFLEQVALVKESDKFKVLINAKVKADIVHVHSLNLRYYLRLNQKTPSVVYCHLLPETLDGSIKLPKLIFRLFKRYVVRFYQKADWLVVVNPIFIEPLVKYGVKRERIVYIPNYVDQKDFHILANRDELKATYGVTGFTVLGVGQVQTRKGVLDFIETARRLPDMSFVWAGGFSFKGITDGYKELKEAMETAPKNVKFLGIIPREKMNEVYNIADVMFLPSFNELFPMSILESIQLDLPFLVRDLDLYEPIFDGHYVKAHDVDGFTQTIKRLANDEKFYEQAVAHSAYNREFYNKSSILAMWEKFYETMLNDHR